MPSGSGKLVSTGISSAIEQYDANAINGASSKNGDAVSAVPTPYGRTSRCRNTAERSTAPVRHWTRASAFAITPLITGANTSNASTWQTWTPHGGSMIW